MKRVTKTNVMFTGVILIYIIMIFVVNLFPKGTIPFNVTLVLPEFVILASALLICFLIKSSAPKDANVEKVPISTCLKSVGLAYLCMPLIGVVNSLTSSVSGNAVEGTLEKVNSNPLWFNIVAIALLPAVIEEYIFRGLILGTYKKRNPFAGIILSSFLFGILHLNFNQLSYAFLLGTILGFLTYATGSIIPSIIMHFTINANSVVMSFLSDKLLKKLEDVENLGLEGSGTGAVQNGLMDNIVAVLTVICIVAIATAFAVILFVNICKENRGIKSVTAIIKKPMRSTYNDEGKFIDGYLLTGIIVGTAFIIYFDFVVKLLQ